MSESNNKPPVTAPIPATHIEMAEADIISDRGNSLDNPKFDAADLSRVDHEVAEYAGASRIEVDEKTSKRLKRMIDRRVLSVMIITYFLQALDKGTISFVSIMGFNEDTNLVDQQVRPAPEEPNLQHMILTFRQKFSWLTTCIYIAILVVEYPTNLIIQRVPIAKYLSFNIMAWGAILACHAACRNFASLVAVRTLLGICEACCQPTFVALR